MSSMYITEPSTSGKVCLNTTLGDIDIELWCKECPLACKNFIQLCMEGYYDGCIFHRLVKDFIVQTGDPSATGFGGESVYGGVFKSEFHQRLKFNRRGLVGMAGDKKDSNGSQFFFTLSSTPELDKKHTLFGRVANNTVFNLIKINELDVDKNERPTRIHKITGAKILNNPFDDIKVRKEILEKRAIDEKKASKKDSDKKRPATSLKTSLLSFTDEMEDDEPSSFVAKKLKSAHDVLEDDLLSKEAAVKPEELGNSLPDDYKNDDNDQPEGRLDKVKERLKERKKRVRINDEVDEDFERAIDEQNEAQKREEMEKLSAELKQLQKDYKKSLKPAKEPEAVDEEASSSAVMKEYKKLHLKFKSATKGIVKTIDPKREEQTIALLERFKTKLDRGSVLGVLSDKKIDLSDLKTQEEIIDASSEEQGKIDLDAEDIAGNDWMNHWFVAPEDTSGVTKAKDPSMREKNQEWFSIDDPRNPINIQRRTAAEKMDS